VPEKDALHAKGHVENEALHAQRKRKGNLNLADDLFAIYTKGYSANIEESALITHEPLDTAQSPCRKRIYSFITLTYLYLIREKRF
jgi:hypothetical protein